jgi:addiction module RelB/DinJ family antitoxin
MTEQVRYRIHKNLVRDATKVFDAIGVTPSAAVSMFFAQVVHQRGLPFKPSEFPALEEYGADLEGAAKAEKEARTELAADKQAGRLFEFKGNLP